MESIDSLVFTLGEDTDRTFPQFFMHATFLATAGFVLGWSIEKVSTVIGGYISWRPGFVTGLIQIILNIIVLYLLSISAFSFASEFQKTYAGLIFIMLLFGMQRGLINRLYAN